MDCFIGHVDLSCHLPRLEDEHSIPVHLQTESSVEKEQSASGSASQVDEEQSIPVHLQIQSTVEKEQSAYVSASQVDEEQTIPVHLQTQSTVEKEQSAYGSASQVDEEGNVSKEHVQGENGIAVESKKKQKPKRPCLFCGAVDSRLPRHILTKHRTEPLVQPLINLPRKEQLYRIGFFRRDGIKQHNLKVIEGGGCNFMREREVGKSDESIMCSGCNGFFSRSYAARHKKVCPAIGNNFMIPIADLDRVKSLTFNDLDKNFKGLLDGLRLDKVGNYVKGDPIILMIGVRSFERLKKKKDKKVETKRTVRARMRILARLYLNFQQYYSNQSEVCLPEVCGNSADIFHRDVMTILGKAINDICERNEDNNDDDSILSHDKNGLKIYIYNTLKLAGKYLIGYYLMKRQDTSADETVNFLKVLKYYEDDLFGDAYYALNTKKNVTSKKAISLPKEDDVDMIYNECYTTIENMDAYKFTGETEFVEIRTATCTPLMLFNARRGGEPPRLVMSQWLEALNGDWVDEEDRENQDADLLITYQTG